MMAVRRERRPRQKTYPGPNPEDNQQMLQDIKDSIATDSSADKVSSRPVSSGGLEEMRTERPLERERPESRDREQSSRRERRSPPSDREQASPGTTSTQRSQQNRSTPTKQLTQFNSERNQKQLREIRKSLRPWVKSDPGFHSSKDQVNPSMLDQLISMGHSEVSLS
jgi:hypothetical protein